MRHIDEHIARMRMAYFHQCAVCISTWVGYQFLSILYDYFTFICHRSASALTEWRTIRLEIRSEDNLILYAAGNRLRWKWKRECASVVSVRLSVVHSFSHSFITINRNSLLIEFQNDSVCMGRSRRWWRRRRQPVFRTHLIRARN